jgi:hypothetical protein
MKHGASIFGFGMFWARISFPVPTYGCKYISAPFIVSDFLVGFSSLDAPGYAVSHGVTVARDTSSTAQGGGGSFKDRKP